MENELNRRDFICGAALAAAALAMPAQGGAATRKLLKRSQVNQIVKVAKKVFADLGLRLPPFAFMTTDDWAKAGHEYDEIRDCNLGWDVTDFGMEDFAHYGRCLFTLRNGKNNSKYPKPYCEKFILDPEGQCAPEHFHKIKREDIINRGIGDIVIDLAASTPDGHKDTRAFEISIDGVRRSFPKPTRVVLKPGQSICLEPGIVHSFWGEGGYLIDGVHYTASGEVSFVCNDFNDNFFLNGAPRFPGIDEDVPRDFYLCQEYPAAKV